MDTEQAYVWRLQNFVIGEHILRPCLENPTPVKACAISACGNFAVLGTAGGWIERFNLQSGISRGSYVDTPKGSAHDGESIAEGAIRETWEEAGAEVEVISPFAQLDIPLTGQTYVIFLAKLKKPQFSPGPESSECCLFELDDIPFDSLAVSSIFVTLNLVSPRRTIPSSCCRPIELADCRHNVVLWNLLAFNIIIYYIHLDVRTPKSLSQGLELCTLRFAPSNPKW